MSDAAPVETAEEPAAASLAPDGGRRRLVLAAAALFGLSVGLAVLAAFLANRLDAEQDRGDEVRQVAGRFATALLTYDFEKLDESKQRVLALSTGNFKRQYEQAFSGGLDVLLKETKARSEATVSEIYLGEVDDGTATAIVVADALAAGTAGARRTASSYIQLDLVKVGGRWRVDGVTNLNFTQAPAPASTTTTPPE